MFRGLLGDRMLPLAGEYLPQTLGADMGNAHHVYNKESQKKTGANDQRWPYKKTGRPNRGIPEYSKFISQYIWN